MAFYYLKTQTYIDFIFPREYRKLLYIWTAWTLRFLDKDQFHHSCSIATYSIYRNPTLVLPPADAQVELNQAVMAREQLQCPSVIVLILESNLNFLSPTRTEKLQCQNQLGLLCCSAVPSSCLTLINSSPVLPACLCLLLATFLPCLSLSNSPNPTYFYIILIYFPPLSPKSRQNS